MMPRDSCQTDSRPAESEAISPKRFTRWAGDRNTTTASVPARMEMVTAALRGHARRRTVAIKARRARDETAAMNPIREREAMIATRMSAAAAQLTAANRKGPGAKRWGDGIDRSNINGTTTAKGRIISSRPAYWLRIAKVPTAGLSPLTDKATWR